MSRFVFYFAYGSNLLPRRLAERVPSSRFVTLAALPGHRLCWHKRGGDGSGKCDVQPGAGSEQVIGAVYRMQAAEQPLLDRAEGLGAGYNLVHRGVGALPSGDELEVFYYQADAAHVDAVLRPYRWYHALVSAGARHHDLPRAYRDAIDRVAPLDDPDVDRDRLHRALLERARTDGGAPLSKTL